jgi:hypothetical protein
MVLLFDISVKDMMQYSGIASGQTEKKQSYNYIIGVTVPLWNMELS